MIKHTLALTAVALTISADPRAQQGTPKLADLAAQARTLQTDGQRIAALSIYRQILAVDPQNAAAHLGIGEALDLEGQFAEARVHLQTAIEVSPETDVNAALSAMGISHAFQGNAAEAAKYYQRGFDRHVQAGRLESAAGTANALGRVYLELGDRADAAKWYRIGYDTATKVTGRTPAQADLIEMRWQHAQARMAAKGGQFDAARTHAEQVRLIVERGRLDPSQNVNYPHVVGYVALSENNPDGAIAELAKADQDDPFILGLMARAYELKKNEAKARELYARIVALSGHSLQMAFVRQRALRAVGK